MSSAPLCGASRPVLIVALVACAFSACSDSSAPRPAPDPSLHSLSLSGLPAMLARGLPAKVTVTARDLFGHDLRSYTGTVHFTSSDPAAQLPADYAFTPADSGAHEFSVLFAAEGTPSVRVAEGAIADQRVVSVCQALYVNNAQQDTSAGYITIYPACGVGDVPPSAVIGGPNTGLGRGTRGIALDGSGRLAVAGSLDNAIRIFAPGASGDVAPIATIQGPSTDLGGPAHLTFDRAGRLYVSNHDGWSITGYSPGANGNVAPIDTIVDNDLIRSPGGIAIDNAGAIHVFVSGAGSEWNDPFAQINTYIAGRPFNSGPIATLESDDWLVQCLDMAFDNGGRLYLAEESYDGANTYFGVLAYDSAASGFATAVTYIGGNSSGISSSGGTPPHDPFGLAFDHADRLYLSIAADNYILIFAAGASGNLPPVAVITGPHTLLSAPLGIAMR